MSTDMNNVTLRDLFAAAAMIGELASQSEDAGYYEVKAGYFLAERCYSLADAMMAERKKRMETK